MLLQAFAVCMLGLLALGLGMMQASFQEGEWVEHKIRAESFDRYFLDVSLKTLCKLRPVPSHY
jgi:hypothetical protein